MEIKCYGGPLDGCLAETEDDYPINQLAYTAKKSRYVYTLLVSETASGSMEYVYKMSGITPPIEKTTDEICDEMQDSIRRIADLTNNPPEE